MDPVCFCSGVHCIPDYEKLWQVWQKCCLKINCKVLLIIVVLQFFYQIFCEIILKPQILAINNGLKIINWKYITNL